MKFHDHTDKNNELWHWYMRVIHGAGIGDVRAWAQLDLTMPQLKILIVLYMKEETTVGQLAEMLNTSLPNMTGLLDRLEAQGFVERVPSKEDRRVIYIRITAEASEIFKRLNQSGYDKLHRVMGQLSEQDQQSVMQGLRLLSEAFDKDERA